MERRPPHRRLAVIPLPTLGLVLGIALLGVIGALVTQTARWNADQQDLRQKDAAETVEAILRLHLQGDAEMLGVLATMIGAHTDPDSLREGLERFLSLQPHAILCGRVERDGQVSFVLPATRAPGDAERLLRRAADASPAGFSQAFSCGAGRCIGLARAIRRSGGDEGTLVVVSSLDRWLEHMQPHFNLSGVHVRLRDRDGTIVAATPPAKSAEARVYASVPLDPPGHGLQLEVSMPPGPPRWLLPGLGLLSFALGLSLVGALGALEAHLRRRRRAVAETARLSAESERNLAALVTRLGAVNDTLAAIVDSENLFIAGQPTPVVFKAVLAAAVRLTGSAFGFIGEILPAADGSPVLKSYAISDIAWDEATRRLYRQQQGAGLEFRNLSTLFGVAMRTGEVVIANDAGHDPRAGGLPEGHPPLDCFVGIPLKHGGDTVGMLGLANRPGGYDAAVLADLDPLLATGATLIEATRSAQLRRTSERELRLREGAVDAAANAIVLTDRNGAILWVNRAFATLSGYAPEEAIGKTPRFLRSGVHPPEYYRAMWATILRGDVWRGEMTNRRKDGALYVEEMTITPLRVDSGDVTHFVAVKQDVGWRHDAQRQIRKSEDRFHSLVQSVDAIVWEAEPDPRAPERFRVTFVSDRARAILGHPREDWLETGFWAKQLHPSDAARVRGQWQAEILDGDGGELDCRMRAADGRWVWCRGIVRTTRDAGGRPTRISGLVIDVTRTRQMEQALVGAADEWRATFDALDAALMVLDETGRMERLNRAATRLLGGDWRACLGRVPWEICGEEPWLTARAVCRGEAPAGGRIRDGQDRAWDIEVLRTPATEERRGRVILTLRDVTRMVELQDSARQAETWTTLGSLVAGVAHEVRNPLFAMSVNIDALDAVLRGHQDVTELVQALRQERDRLSRLMQELLHYGRPAPAEFAPGSLEPVLESALAHSAPLAASRGVRLTREGSAAGVFVLMNAGRLEEVFDNLLENACQHSPGGLEVRLEVEVQPLDADRRRIRCRVRDAGPGFPSDALERVFEPFFTRRKGGTGLGLAIVARYVAEHGGRVRAQNHPDGGAVVVVDLPLLPDGVPTRA